MKPDPETDPQILRVRAAAADRRPSLLDDTPRASGPGQTREPNAAVRRHSPHVDPMRARRTLIEKIITDAQAAGAFDNLPHVGERLPLEDDSAAGEMASAFRILRDAGAAPAWIETDKEIRRLLAERDVTLDRATRAGPLSRERYRNQLRTLVADHNRLIFVLSHEAPSPRQHRRPLDLERELAALEGRWPKGQK